MISFANRLIISTRNRDIMQSIGPEAKRPLGVTIIAIVAAAGGLLSLFGGASRLAGMGTGPVELAYIVIIFGVLGLALGAGFYTGARWAWMAGIIIYIISIGLGIAEIVYGGNVGFIGGIIRTIAGIVIPVYLTRPKPKSFFGNVPALTGENVSIAAMTIFSPRTLLASAPTEGPVPGRSRAGIFPTYELRRHLAEFV